MPPRSDDEPGARRVLGRKANETGHLGGRSCRRMAETTCITRAILTSFAGSLSRFSGTTPAASWVPHCLHGALRSFKGVPDAIKTVGASRTGIAAAQRSGISRAAAREAARYCCSLLAGILLPDGRTEVMGARVRKSPAADDEVAGSRGARVIVLFPRPAVAPPRPWWRRALRWLRYGTSGIWRARPGQVEPRAARVRERPSRRLRTRVG